MIGFLPTAGTNERWGAGYKELLPLGEKQWLLDNAIHSLFEVGCSEVVIATSPIKASVHMLHIQRLGIENVSFILGGNTMWETMQNYFPYSIGHQETMMMLPDTMTDISQAVSTPDSILTFGTFLTHEPERFSILVEDQFLTKPHNLTGKYRAWGAVRWNTVVSQFWMSTRPLSYDHAFNMAMEEYHWNQFDLPFYYDFANWNEYDSYLKGRSA